MSKFSILIINDGCLNSPSSSGSVRKKLCCTATVHGTKVRDSFIDSSSNRQETVILENDGSVIAKFLCNIFTFLFAEDNATAPEISVQSQYWTDL
jgi:hypothetical protein